MSKSGLRILTPLCVFVRPAFPGRPERPQSRCEQQRDSVQGALEPRGPRPVLTTYVPQCDADGQYRPLQVGPGTHPGTFEVPPPLSVHQE